MWSFRKKREPAHKLDVGILVDAVEAGLHQCEQLRPGNWCRFQLNGRSFTLWYQGQLMESVDGTEEWIPSTKEQLERLRVTLFDKPQDVFNRRLAERIHDHYDRLLKEHEE